MGKIRFGVTIDAAPEMLQDADYGSIKEIALRCEDLNFYSLCVMDHFTWGEGGRGAVFDAWTLLSALSAETSRIRLGTLVACNSYRNPALTAKIAATLDNISGGRLIFGYGAGWKRDEYDAYGFPFPAPSARVRQMREGVELIKRLWTEERTSFEGKFYRVKNAICEPKPKQKPHPPVIIGGTGEKLTLRTAAELGDGWNAWGASIEDYEKKVDILTSFCEGIGRRIEDIEFSWSGDMILAKDDEQLKLLREKSGAQGGITCTYDDCTEVLQKYIDLGCSHFIFASRSFNREKERFVEEIAPSF